MRHWDWFRLFSFDRSDDNHHSFSWQWKDKFRSVQFPAPGQTQGLWRYLGNDYEQGSTVVRVGKDAALWVRRKVSGDRAVVHDGRRVLSQHFEVAP